MASRSIMTYHEYKARKDAEKLEQKTKQLSIDEQADKNGKSKDKKKKGNGKEEIKKPNKNNQECEIEQHISIMPNPAARRGSMANYAFPELHPKAKLRNEPDNLLVLTTTRIDNRGRRHSVAVPLVPPPDGEPFEGGYRIERNPITGGARLVPPSSSPGSSGPVKKSAKEKKRGLRMRAMRSLSSSFSQSPSNSNSNLPTINERSATKSDGRRPPVERRLSSAPPSTSSSSGAGGSSDSRPSSSTAASSSSFRGRSNSSCANGGSSVAGGQPSHDRSPAQPPEALYGRRGRRHSIQVSSGSKDMERLRVPDRSSSLAVPGQSSAKKGEIKRTSSKRRSSRQGFLHFLDLAIAN